jgi:hypothetical protein
MFSRDGKRMRVEELLGRLGGLFRSIPERSDVDQEAKEFDVVKVDERERRKKSRKSEMMMIALWISREVKGTNPSSCGRNYG